MTKLLRIHTGALLFWHQIAFQKIPMITVEPPNNASAMPEYSRPLMAVARARSLPADVLSFVREMMKNSRLVQPALLMPDKPP